MDALRIVIADDHPVFLNGLRALLVSEPEIEVVGEATSGDEAVAVATATQPDIVLIDLQMPGSGIVAMRRILEVSPRVRVLVVTMFDDDDSVFAVLRAGARGYVLKGAGPAEVLRAVRAVGAGEAIFSPTIAQRLLDLFAFPYLRSVPFPELTEREREILTLIVQGQANPAIAARLALSLKTVRNHISNIFSKLQVADRAEAALRAREAGMRPDQRWRWITSASAIPDCIASRRVPRTGASCATFALALWSSRITSSIAPATFPSASFTTRMPADGIWHGRPWSVFCTV